MQFVDKGCTVRRVDGSFWVQVRSSLDALMPGSDCVSFFS